MAVGLRDKIALITGASRGLGEAIAREFHAQSANLILVARKHKEDDSLERVAQSLTEKNKYRQWVRTIGVDLCSATAVSKLMRSVDRVDILVNNAAILGPSGDFQDNDMLEWTDCIRVNLLAPVALCQACIPLMRAHNRGKIVNISGGGATTPRVGYTAYSSSKTALVRFSETLALEMAQYNIDVNCVAPGLLPTRMSAWQGEDGALEKAAKLVAMLAGRESDGISGRLISAQYDDWQSLPARWEDVRWSNIYTLRRVVNEMGYVHA